MAAVEGACVMAEWCGRWERGAVCKSWRYAVAGIGETFPPARGRQIAEAVMNVIVINGVLIEVMTCRNREIPPPPLPSDVKHIGHYYYICLIHH